VADDTALADRRAAGLELRLDQGYEPGVRRAASLSAAGSAWVRLMKLTSATMTLTASGISAASIFRASVASGGTTRGVGAQIVVELPAAHVHGIDLGRAAREERFSEAASRGADIERDAAGRIQAEGVEGCGELQPAAGDVVPSAWRHGERRVFRHHGAWLQRRLAPPVT
jgi:hypothetical protein